MAQAQTKKNGLEIFEAKKKSTSPETKRIFKLIKS